MISDRFMYSTRLRVVVPPPLCKRLLGHLRFFVSDVLIFYFRSSKYDIRVLREKLIYVEYRKYVYLQKKCSSVTIKNNVKEGRHRRTLTTKEYTV